MILARLSRAIREQNWFAVALEFVIVVAGVLLAFQVTAWNEARADRALEQQYLQRLYDDMSGSLEDYAANDGWDVTRLRTQALVLDALRSGELRDEDREDFARGLIFVGSHNPIRRRWGTVEELKATGNITVLRDLELRTMIAEVDGDFHRAYRVVSESIEQILLLRVELLARFAPLEYGFNTADAASAEFDFEALAADTEFINIFAHVQLNSEQAVAFNDGHMRRIAALRDMLADRLDINEGVAAP